MSADLRELLSDDTLHAMIEAVFGYSWQRKGLNYDKGRDVVAALTARPEAAPMEVCQHCGMVRVNHPPECGPFEPASPRPSEAGAALIEDLYPALSDQKAQWTLDNIYTLARRESKRNNDGKMPRPEMWAHVLRLCEAMGCKERTVGILRDGAARPALPATGTGSGPGSEVELQAYYRGRREMAAELAATGTGAWQDIETAPKDGSAILGFMPSYYQRKGGFAVVVWMDYTDRPGWYSDVASSHEPTMWQRLEPPAPATARG